MVYVVHKCATSVDGYINDHGPERLLLSNDEDFDRLDALRASCDAILVGAGTIRTDNPRLMIRSEKRQQERIARGSPPQPLKATLTCGGRLPADALFFALGDSPKIVYCPQDKVAALQESLQGRAVVVGDGRDVVAAAFVLEDLAKRGVRRLLLEGGSGLATVFHSAGLVDELHLSIAPFFVGDDRAPRFVQPDAFPFSKKRPMRLVSAEPLGDLALLIYRLEKR